MQAVPALGSAAAPAAPATLPVPLGGSPAAPQVVSAFATSGSARGDLALDAAPRDAPSSVAHFGSNEDESFPPHISNRSACVIQDF